MQVAQASTERPVVLEGALTGREAIATPGLAVPATELKRSFRYDMGGAGTINRYDAAGYLIDTQTVLGEESGAGSYSGYLTYTEDIDVLDAVFGKATPTSVEVTGKKRVYSPALNSLVNPQTYTMVYGGSRKERYPMMVYTGFTWTFNRAGVTKSGDIIAQAMEDNYVPSGSELSPTLTDLQAVIPSTVALRIGNSAAAAAAATPFRRGFEAVLAVTGAWGLGFPLVNDNIGPDAIVQLKPDISFTLRGTKGSALMAFLANMRGSTAVYIELSALGKLITGTTYHSLKILLAGMVSDFPSNSDDAGIRQVAWTFVPVQVADANGLDIEIISTLT